MAIPSRAHELFARYSGAISRAAGIVCQRRHLQTQEREDFTHDAIVKALDDDAALLRKLDGRDDPVSYLVTAFTRLWTDRSRAERGRFRPSAAARRHGTIAVELERLVACGGFTAAEAVQTVLCRPDVNLSADQLARILADLHPRLQPRLVALGELDGTPEPAAPAATAEDRLIAAEIETITADVLQVLRQFIRSVPAAEQALIPILLGEVNTREAARRAGIGRHRMRGALARLTRRIIDALMTNGHSPDSVRALLAGPLRDLADGEQQKERKNERTKERKNEKKGHPR